MAPTRRRDRVGPEDAVGGKLGGGRRWSRPSLSVRAAVAVGGALGAPARYGISLAVHITPGTFPWGTFWTNMSGSFAIGLVLAFLLERFPPTRYLRPFAATG